MNDRAPSLPLSRAPIYGSFQDRVLPWLNTCFGEVIAGDIAERNHRFVEEALELVQACGCTASEAHQLVDYVFGRPIGERTQETGGVMVTLAALCLAHGLDMHEAGETELARIWTKVEAIRAKQAAKPKHSPLPEHPAAETREAIARIIVEAASPPSGFREDWVKHALPYADRILSLPTSLQEPQGGGECARTIEILRRALAWHGDPARMATTREEWQQEVDAAIVWVNANPEPDRPSFSSLATLTADETTRYKAFERIITGISTLDADIDKQPGAHRVLWHGVWHEGPMADAFIELIEALAAKARAALAGDA